LASAQRTRQRSLADTAAPWFLALVAALLLADLALIFLWAPTELVLGEVQRIFYFHVPSAMVGFMAFAVVAVGSVGYFWKRTAKWDRLAHSAVEVGLMFFTVALISGAIWAKPVWGTWWTWDPQLTTTFVLWVVYLVYLMVRAYVPSKEQAARYSAVIGIMGFPLVLLVYRAAELWAGIHPGTVVGPGAESDALDNDISLVFTFSLATFTLLFAYLLWQRVLLHKAEETVEELRASVR
jgi:heme exporter protein C